MNPTVPPVKDLVLLGGGHSHIQVLKRFGMHPMPGVRLTLITRDYDTPYSGMLPGYVAGEYTWRELHIDLARLARFADARIIRTDAVGLDPDGRRVTLAGRPDLRFDVLSINTGAEPGAGGERAVSVKPIGSFLPQWQHVRSHAGPDDHVVVVGGGAGGVEIALAMRRALGPEVAMTLITDRLLAGHPPKAVQMANSALTEANVNVLSGRRVSDVDDHGVALVDGDHLDAGFVFWVTGVDAPTWISQTGLARDGAGFIAVSSTLQSTSHDWVFAAGDVAAMVDDPRPKSGVFAVRQGPVLAANLRRYLAEGSPKQFRAQKRFLSLLGTADGEAIATRGGWAARGAWAWRWKTWIDRRFMARFQDLPEMTTPRPAVVPAIERRLPPGMRCGGCGSKIAAEPLHRVLARLAPKLSNRVVRGLGDDAAVVEGAGGRWVLTVDGFRTMVDDPYLFGRIAAHHGLNDVIAMGSLPTTALAYVTVPLMADAMMEDELYWVMKGAVDVFDAVGVDLVGGHSAEGDTLSIALTIAGEANVSLLEKGPLSPGDHLVLTKPIGTGVVLAADMAGAASSSCRTAVHSLMDQSNVPALEIARRHGVTAATDVTGFGLVGHLAEMLRAGNAGIRLHVDHVPALEGAIALLDAGYQSSLQDSNEWVFADFSLDGLERTDPRVRLLADPQTSGGLLLALPGDRADGCVTDLVAAGFHAADVATAESDGWRIVS